MTIMTIRIPEDVKEAFDKAAEKRAPAEDLAERRRKAVDAILEHRKTMPILSQEEFRSIREEMRSFIAMAGKAGARRSHRSRIRRA